MSDFWRLQAELIMETYQRSADRIETLMDEVWEAGRVTKEWFAITKADDSIILRWWAPGEEHSPRIFQRSVDDFRLLVGKLSQAILGESGEKPPDLIQPHLDKISTAIVDIESDVTKKDVLTHTAKIREALNDITAVRNFGGTLGDLLQGLIEMLKVQLAHQQELYGQLLGDFTRLELRAKEHEKTLEALSLENEELRKKLGVKGS